MSSVSPLLSIKLGQSAFLFSVQRNLSNNYQYDKLSVYSNCAKDSESLSR